MDEQIKQEQVPWYESNLLWGPIPLGGGIVLSVVAGMKHDLRWVLYFAIPCFIFPSWVLLRRWFRRWALAASVLVAVLLICGGFYWMSKWLGKGDTQQAIGTPLGNVTAPPAQSSPITDNLVITPVPKAKPAKKPSQPSLSPITVNGDKNTVGAINQEGHNNIAQVGDNNQATIGTVPPPQRKLTDVGNFTLAVSRRPSKILILYTQNDSEAYILAKQIGDALSAAGWTLTQPVTAAMAFTDTPRYGVEVDYRGAQTTLGSRVDIDPNAAWGVLSQELMRLLPEEFHISLSPNAQTEYIQLIVYPNPKLKPAPSAKIEQHGDGNGAVGGNLSVGPCSNSSVGGINVQQTVNCVPPVRHIPPELRPTLVLALSIQKGTIDLEVMSGDTEASDFAYELNALFRDAGWTLKNGDILPQALVAEKNMYLTFHGDAVPTGQKLISMESRTPEGRVAWCLHKLNVKFLETTYPSVPPREVGILIGHNAP
jgi:hypothetical protein